MIADPNFRTTRSSHPTPEAPAIDLVMLIPYFAKAKDTPRMPIPRKANAMQAFLLWLKVKLSLNSDKATLAITPDVMANMAP